MNQRVFEKKSSTIYTSLLGAVACFSCFSLFSQHLSFRNYNVNHGLPSSMIYAAFQDSKGYMWFATDMGVSRYDGYEFRNYTINDGLSDNEVFSFFEDSNGRIWFATLNGKVSYYLSGEIYNSQTDPTLLPMNSDSYICGFIEEPDSTVWMATYRSGVVSYSPAKSVNRYFTSRFRYIGNILPFDSTHFRLLAENEIYAIPFEPGYDGLLDLPASQFDIKPGTFKSVQLSNGYVAFTGKMNDCVYIGDNHSGESKLIYQDPQRKMKVYNVCADITTLWICTSRGAIPYDYERDSFSTPLLEAYNISSVMKDNEGNFWITTLGDGAFFCSANAIYSYTPQEGLLTESVTCLAADGNDRIWIGYEKGAVGIIEKGELKTIKIFNGEAYEKGIINKMSFNYGKLWIAANYGLVLLHNQQKQLLPIVVKDALEYPEGHIWHATSLLPYGVTYFKKSLFEKWMINAEGFRTQIGLGSDLASHIKVSERAKRLFKDSRDVVWMSTEKNLYRYKDNKVENITSGFLRDAAYVNDFGEHPDGTILLATNIDGIIAVNGDRVFSIKEEDGLSSSYCSTISVDDEGIIWVGTNKGLNKITGFPDEPKITQYDVNDGMLSNEVQDVLVVNDTVWIATRKGINLFDKRKSISDLKPPIMLLNGISVHEKPVNLNGKDILLHHNENDIRLHFTGISYNSGGEILYRYRLNDESPWNYTRNTMIDFPQLPPGDYHFTVSSRGKSSSWSKPVSLNFVIKKPFWKTHAFIVTELVLMLGAVWLVTAAYFTYRRNKILQKYRLVNSELKALRAQINPHFLFNALNSIQGVLLKNNMDAAQYYLGKFGTLMRMILDHSDKLNITIDEEIKALKNYLEIESLRSNYQFQYNITVSESIDVFNTEIPAMILQPFVENAVWHGLGNKTGQGNLIIDFDLENEHTIVITICDDGIGRKKTMELNAGKKKHKSKGMQLVRERIEILNMNRQGKIILSIVDLEDDHGNHPGTKVMIKIPNHEHYSE